MSHSFRRLFLLLGLSGMVAVMALPTHTSAAPARHAGAAPAGDSTDTLTVLTSPYMLSGLTPQTVGEGGSGTISSWYHYYHALWQQRFPHLAIHEIYVGNVNDYQTKVILSINAGNPPDLIGFPVNLGQLVARHTVMNLDSYYKRAGITARYFLPAMADYARYHGHWYAMPAASYPSYPDIVYFPRWVKAAGWNPTSIPTTWDGLWAATRKVTKWDSAGNLMRIGIPVDAPNDNEENLFCGHPAVYDARTATLHANSTCIKNYFRYELRLLQYYGGLAKYTRFASGDPGMGLIYSCSNKAYYVTGKVIFNLGAWWDGGQMDTCPNYRPDKWSLSWAPTPHGILAERRAVTTTAWTLLIPTGAKHPQLAFDFVKFTCWMHGDLMGPTTNGFVVAGQGGHWAQTFATVEGQTRGKNHLPGNPIADALKVVSQEAEQGQASTPTSDADPYYEQLMSHAWQQVEYGRATVDQALDQVQRLVDIKEKALHTQAGM